MPLKSAKRSGGDLSGLVLALLGAAQEVVDQHLGMHLLLDVQRWRRDDEVAPVLLVLAAPDELRVDVAISGRLLLAQLGGVGARVANLLRLLLFGRQHRLVFGGRDVLAPGLVVGQRFDALGIAGSGHGHAFAGRITVIPACLAV
jgi:hypothetical protein